MTLTKPTREDFKNQAKRLRETLAQTGTVLSHAQALETIARQHGARDWNTLSATARSAAPAQPALPAPGARVSGRYLGHRFDGTVHAISQGGTDLIRITVTFDEPIDVVKFDSFSSMRSRVSAMVRRDGRSPRKTSDGVPHMVLDLG